MLAVKEKTAHICISLLLLFKNHLYELGTLPMELEVCSSNTGFYERKLAIWHPPYS